MSTIVDHVRLILNTKILTKFIIIIIIIIIIINIIIIII
jgi:hypothetical protein